MKNEQENLENAEFQVREANDFPKEELSPNSIDDVAASFETSESALAETNGCDVRWRVAQSLLTIRNQVNLKAPTRSKASDGTIGDSRHCQRQSDHNPWVRDGAIGVVTAIDITHDAGRGCDANAIAESLRANRDARIKYVIFNRKIFNSSAIGNTAPWEWRPYTGENPHTAHVHISVRPDKPSYDSTSAWPI